MKCHSNTKHQHVQVFKFEPIQTSFIQKGDEKKENYLRKTSVSIPFKRCIFPIRDIVPSLLFVVSNNKQVEGNLNFFRTCWARGGDERWIEFCAKEKRAKLFRLEEVGVCGRRVRLCLPSDSPSLEAFAICNCHCLIRTKEFFDISAGQSRPPTRHAPLSLSIRYRTDGQHLIQLHCIPFYDEQIIINDLMKYNFAWND